MAEVANHSDDLEPRTLVVNRDALAERRLRRPPLGARKVLGHEDDAAAVDVSPRERPTGHQRCAKRFKESWRDDVLLYGGGYSPRGHASFEIDGTCSPVAVERQTVVRAREPRLLDPWNRLHVVDHLALQGDGLKPRVVRR